MHTRGHLSAFYYGENTKLTSTLTDAIEQLNSVKQIVFYSKKTGVNLHICSVCHVLEEQNRENVN